MSEDEKPEEAADTPADSESEDSGAEGAEGSEENETETEETPKTLKDKLLANLKFIIIGAVVLVFGGSGAGLYFSGVFDEEKLHETTVALPGELLYYELPRITVDLKPSKKRARPFIRLLMQVHLQGETAKAAFIENEVKIMDAVQTHLRTISAEDLSGTEGTQRLRQDFIIIINNIIAPEHAVTVFYKEILIR